MAKFIDNFQEKIKSSSNLFAMVVFRLVTGLLVGLTLALIGQEIIRYEWIGFLLLLCTVTMGIFRVSRSWSWTHLLIFNLICVLIGLLLRMYILIAPGA